MPTEYTTEQRACARCGQPFVAFPSAQRRGQGRYCSKACADAAKCIPLIERFCLRVDKSADCWIWTGRSDRHGYGTFSVNHNSVRAHRLSWELHRGPIPDGLWVLHNCPGGDNRLCVNPGHLWLGTTDDNMADMVAKGRSAAGSRHWHRRYPDYHPTAGEGHGNARLTEADVRTIRATAKPYKVTARMLADRYGVTVGAIKDILYGKSWQHLL